MRKTLSKIAGLALGLSLAAGVGVFVGSKTVSESVHAGTPTNGTSYELVTSTDGLTAGANYIIATAKTGSAYLASTTSTNNYRPLTSSVTITDSKITFDGSTMLNLELGGSSGAWTLKTTNYAGTNGYLRTSASSSGSNYLYVNSSADSANYDKYQISFSSDAAVIKCNGSNTRWISFGNGDRISSYRNQNQSAIYLFKEAASTCTHNWVAGTVHAATCTEDGYTEYECSLCHLEKNDDLVPAFGHSFGEWEQVTAPSCLNAGEERRICSHDSSHVETRPIAALGHSYVNHICERCGAEEPNEDTVGYVFSEHYSTDTSVEEVPISINDYITVTFVKGGTETKYYANGTAVRWYGGGTFTFESSAGNITSITITYSRHDNSVSSDVGSYTDITGASGSATWVGDSSTVVFTQSGTTGQDRISQISVTYDLGNDPIVSYTITYIANAEDATGSMSPTSGATPHVAACSFTRDGYEFARWNTQADGEGDNYDVDTIVEEDLTLYAIWQEYVAPIEGDVSMEGVTSSSSVTVNSHPALKCGAGSTAGAMKLVLKKANINHIKVYVAGWKGDTTNNTVDVSISSGSVSPTSITLTEDTNITGSSTAFTLVNPETTYKFEFTVSGAAVNAEITLTAHAAKNNRFVVWGATDLFAESFANEFNSNLTCDATGEDGPSFTSGHDWTTMNSFYNGLDAEEKGRLHDATFTVSGSGSSTVVAATGDTVQSVAEAMARYDYILAKYGTSEYTNFIGRSVTKLAPARMIDGTISSSSSTIIIVVVALTSITSIGVLLVIKRRRSLVK